MLSPTDQTLALVILIGTGVLGFVLAGSIVIGANLGAQAHLEDAGFLAHPASAPSSPIPGSDARWLFRRSVAMSVVLPFAPLGVASIALALSGSAALALLLAELAFPVVLLAMHRSYRAFIGRVRQEGLAGYSSFDRTPFGDAIHGLWTGLRSGHPQPPKPAGAWAKPPLDPRIVDALDSQLELSPTPVGITIPTTPPGLLPGRSAAAWISWGWWLVAAAWTPWLLVSLPALGLPDGSLRSGMISVGTGAFLVFGTVGFIFGLVGRHRAFVERAAGYTTLRGRDSSMVTFGKGVPADAWLVFGTDHLWHLDPKTGTAIRPPLDPSWALRDRRVHLSLRQLVSRPPQQSS